MNAISTNLATSRPDVAAHLESVRSSAAPSVLDLDPVQVRAMSREMAALIECPPLSMPRRDFTIGAPDGHRIAARLYSPVAANGSAAVILFLHGGGWVLGDVETYDPLCSTIAERMGMTVLSIDYRLAPEHPFPAAIDDALAAARWLSGSPNDVGHPVAGMILAGDSAGGALAAVVAHGLTGACSMPILAQWLIYPLTDLSRTYESDDLGAVFGTTEDGKERFCGYYLGEDAATRKAHPHVSPLLSPNWTGLPPALIFACRFDSLRDQARAYAAKLALHGVPVHFMETEQVHGSFTMRKLLPSAQEDLKRNLDMLRLLIG